MNAKLCNTLFDTSINEYHILDHVDQTQINPYESNSQEDLLLRKNWIDTVQWHLEDIIRVPENSGEQITALKRRIDKSNQDRTDLVEQIDDWFIDIFKDAPKQTNPRLNTETPAWVIDRLSILALKIYHMQEQVNRTDADQKHQDQCQQKLNILLVQREDLSRSLDELLEDIKQGTRYMKVYRQMKMYNDETLNPALYASKNK